MNPDLQLYKKTHEVELNLHIFKADVEKSTAALVFFVCGGWKGFNPKKLYPQAVYFMNRGLTVFISEVRSMQEHSTSPRECVMDAKSSVRWVRQHALEYNLNPDQIIVSGGSAAGHVSLCTALVEGFEEENEDLNISSKANVLCLFNPALAIHSSMKRVEIFGGPKKARDLSPQLLIKNDLPPCLIMQGNQDEITLLSDAKDFAERSISKGNRCDLIIYDGEGHGFFNWFDGSNPRFLDTLRDMDVFLNSLGLIRGKPTIDSFVYKGPSDFERM